MTCYLSVGRRHLRLAIDAETGVALLETGDRYHISVDAPDGDGVGLRLTADPKGHRMLDVNGRYEFHRNRARRVEDVAEFATEFGSTPVSIERQSSSGMWSVRTTQPLAEPRYVERGQVMISSRTTKRPLVRTPLPKTRVSEPTISEMRDSLRSAKDVLNTAKKLFGSQMEMRFGADGELCLLLLLEI